MEVMQFDLKVEDILQLKEVDDEIFIPESDYGFGYIRRTEDGYNFFEIPMYGGQESSGKIFLLNQEADLVEYIQSIC